MIAGPAEVATERGELRFSIESRILRELGERLVKQPEVALLELIKNAYDADATTCDVTLEADTITVSDDGVGMTFEQFANGWMRIGTSSKESVRLTPRHGRAISGEKGIGRFAVRFLGRTLRLTTIADDPDKQARTRLRATFDWPEIDEIADLGDVRVPYSLETAASEEATGTVLRIGAVRSAARGINLGRVRTGSISFLSPLRPLLKDAPRTPRPGNADAGSDPGFSLTILPAPSKDEATGDVARTILDGYVLKAVVLLKDGRVDIKVYKNGSDDPTLTVNDALENDIGELYADLRFLPKRKGVFTGLGMDGRFAYGWVVDNAGVAVFDRTFRVHPYGTSGDDWLQLAADSARNVRDPRSSIARSHFPMTPSVRASTSENYMLRLPQPSQLVGIVQVEGRRSQDQGETEGLVASADREGFVENEAFHQLKDVLRGAAEMIAFGDRALQQEDDERLRRERMADIREQAKAAIEAVQANPVIPAREKAQLVAALVQTERLAVQQDESAREREQQLEVMSLLGVVAGFMTHEFGVALHELKQARRELDLLAERDGSYSDHALALEGHIVKLQEFVTYSQGYIHGSRVRPTKQYKVRPRLQQVVRVFGSYASARGIAVEIETAADLLAPLVPASLYNGIALNLYTNALKAVTAKSGDGPRTIAFRAWNDGRSHTLEVADTGIGIPTILRERVFDPLFTTTTSSEDPLGSGMGLGLPLVKRGAAAFGGTADVVDPPPGFSTCVRVRLPIGTGDDT